MPSRRGYRTERLVRPRHVHQEVALAGDLLLRLLAQLDPGPRVYVLEASGVTRVGRDVVADMIASERYVVPLSRGEVGARETGAPVVGDAPLGIHDVFQHSVQHQDVVRGAALRAERRPLGLHQRLVRYGEHRAIELREGDPPSLI